jgi:transcriptional regulator of aromatic amino acid metabolism
MKLCDEPSGRWWADGTGEADPGLVSFSDMPLLRSFGSARHRPSLLVACADADPDAVIERLQKLCAPPFHRIALPGPLELPALVRGTLLLHDVSELTPTQQAALYDWISLGPGASQIVSVTQAPLHWFVANDRFLERLFYRLNTVCVVATRDRVRH